MDDADRTDARVASLEEVLAKEREAQAAIPLVIHAACDNCGDDMPEARQAAGYALCIECATIKEKEDAFFKKTGVRRALPAQSHDD